MFCNHCGAPIQPGFKLCPNCGNPVVSATGTPATAPSPQPQRSRLERHLRTVGILWMVAGVLWLIPSLVLMGFSHVPRIFDMDDRFAHTFMPPMMLSFGAFFLLIAISGIFMGWGLMNHERWARITAIILSVLALLHPPFGTALGVYTLWVLLPADSASEYERLSR